MKRILPALALLVPLAAAAPSRTSSPGVPKRTTAPPSGNPLPAAAAPDTTPELDAALARRIDGFFDLLQKGKIAESYTRLLEGSALAEDQPELVTDLVDNTGKVLSKCGRVESAAVVRVRSAGKTLREIVCLVNCQKRPLRWKLYAYFGEGRWQIIDTTLDLELSSFFEPEKSARGK